MSWSKLYRRTHLCPSLNKALHVSPLNTRWVLEAEQKYSLLGASYVRNCGGIDFQYRGLMPRNEINGPTLNKCNKLSSLDRAYSLSGLHRNYTNNAATAKDEKSRKMLLYLTGLVFVMVGCTYAAVPLYRRFCQATGYGGTVQRRESVEEKIYRHAKDGTVTTREIAVQFNADVADGMPWKFIPTQREVRVKPGESALAFYTAENRSSAPITGVSTYNVTPMKAAVYFNKIQCFCFEEQRLLPGEQIDMPVFFYIDPEFETDPRMDGINNLILSYTFFKVAEE
ncbi:hypothetical protein RJ640_016902 [Escallonia rubra]|uniref:Cytochrome c oxidase assembly protein COX11, mitochondrial n=1 Tax=Escallonia rubra TaxID=112253 RepID=A0AA88RKF2_9ASTE|nr:hypothetical protein RJ640_016902 [Escallonia rubra]